CPSGSHYVLACDDGYVRRINRASGDQEELRPTRQYEGLRLDGVSNMTDEDRTAADQLGAIISARSARNLRSSIGERDVDAQNVDPGTVQPKRVKDDGMSNDDPYVDPPVPLQDHPISESEHTQDDDIVDPGQRPPRDNVL